MPHRRNILRRPRLVLFASTLLFAALACNFPGSQGATVEITKTFEAISSETAVSLSTSSAGNAILFQTQTAAVPTATATDIPPSETPTLAPSSTTEPGKPTNTPAGPPTQTSIAKETLKVGIEAIVRSGTTALNLRDNPGVAGKSLAMLNGDTRVKIVDGPKAADGFLWWKVTVLTGASGTAGKTGWCSEQSGNNVQTLEAAK